MSLYGPPILFALFLWWFGTGAVLFLQWLPPRASRGSLLVMTGLMVAAALGAVLGARSISTAAAYGGFVCGLMIWAWLELAYYSGAIVGPRRQPSPAGSGPARRFAHAVATTLYHDLAALGFAAVLLAALWDMPNKIALWTFVILWAMQISAKVNVFLGVPNLVEDFLPDHLGFLRSFMTRKPMNAFFPVAVTGSMVVTTLLGGRAAAAEATQFEATGLTLLATLMALAVLEHWLLVVPVPVEALWRWILAQRRRSDARPNAPGPSPASDTERPGSCRPETRLLDAIRFSRPLAPSIVRRPV